MSEYLGKPWDRRESSTIHTCLREQQGSHQSVFYCAGQKAHPLWILFTSGNWWTVQGPFCFQLQLWFFTQKNVFTFLQTSEYRIDVDTTSESPRVKELSSWMIRCYICKSLFVKQWSQFRTLNLYIVCILEGSLSQFVHSMISSLNFKIMQGL